MCVCVCVCLYLCHVCFSVSAVCFGVSAMCACVFLCICHVCVWGHFCVSVSCVFFFVFEVLCFLCEDMCRPFYALASGTMGVCLRGVRCPERPKCKLTVEDATLSFWGVRTPTGDPGAISGRLASVFRAVRTPRAPWVPRASFAKVWYLGTCRGPWDVGFLFLIRGL